jgi:hypothetical protein
MAKAKPKKTIIVQRREENQAGPGQQAGIAELQALILSRGWNLLMDNHEQNIRLIEKQIIEKVDIDGKELNESEIDRLRDRRLCMEDLKNAPREMIRVLENGNSPKEIDFDPYPKSKREAL